MLFTEPSTPTKGAKRNLQAGQAIVLIALLILVLFGMLGLAIDSGRGYVDRRDQQTAVDAAALAAGDWYENFQDLNGLVVPKSVALYQTDLRIYTGYQTASHTSTLVGTNANLPQDTYTYTFAGAYTLTIVATDTQITGYEFDYTSSHNLALAFIQIFGGSTTVPISATATAIVGNQRQTPALLTLSNGSCATKLTGAAQLTVLGDVYTNGTACLDSNLHEAGNCYGAAGSNCGVAQYYCYNSTPGFIPYAPNPVCRPGDTQGTGIVPAPSLPDPGYLAPSVGYYAANQSYNQDNRGSYTEMFPGQYAGHFNLTVVPAPGFGIKHQGGSGNWGVEVTSVRYDRFIDPNIAPNPCYNSPGCRRESAPSSCQAVSTVDGNNSGIDVNITKNAPGAQYYNVYINPNGCDGVPNNFSFVGRHLAPGFIDGGGPPAAALGPYPSGANMTLINGVNGWPCGVPTVTICGIVFNNMSPTAQCFAQTRAKLCQAPDDELKPQCFSNCPPPANLLSQENGPMSLQYPPYGGGDVSNENYCQISPNPGNINSPCQSAQITPGAVQFYFPNGACFDQNSQGATYVFSGEQYNWIVIYSPPGSSCSNSMNGGASTQFIGTIYTPSADWSINGGNRSPLAGQVISYTATVSGSAQVGIDFNPNYAPAPPAARLIN